MHLHVKNELNAKWDFNIKAKFKTLHYMSYYNLSILKDYERKLEKRYRTTIILSYKVCYLLNILGLLTFSLGISFFLMSLSG